MPHNAPTDYQVHLFHEGSLYDAYKLFGAHVIEENNKVYTRFTVFAPNARSIRLVGSFNNWNGEGYELLKVSEQGIWSVLIEANLSNEIYKYEIKAMSGEVILKSDPYAFYSEIRPNTASVVYPYDTKYRWGDHSWLKKRSKKNNTDEPLYIYEMHAGTWRKKIKDDDTFIPSDECKIENYYTYRELASELIPYILEQGFTHIELMPLTEHPFDGSWGYQGTGYYSPTSRYGNPDDLRYFIDQCHQNNIGVLLDWVPGHYCKDAHGLFLFDGAPVYEYQDQRYRENPVWGTANFDLGRPEVQCFLISNARYWMDYFHVDGFRVDAVANMIYWPNTYDGDINPHAIAFMKTLNRVLKEYDPSLLMMAEDSTDWPGVTKPVAEGGLGFTYKWNMGWMNDILEYMETDQHFRSNLHHKVTFSLMYAYSERFILPLSHDEVVHGKKSLLDKMPGSYEEKFSQLKLLAGYMTAHPGKKLLFMGGELGMFSEWKDKEQLDWQLLDYESHWKLNEFFKDLLKLYKRSKPLYELDDQPEGFEWIDVNNTNQSIFSFVRRDKSGNPLIIICNFKNIAYDCFKVGVPDKYEYKEVINSDDIKYGGSNHVNRKAIPTQDEGFHGKPYHVVVKIPPFGITVLRPIKKRKELNQNGKEKNHGNAARRGTRNKA